MTFRLFGRNVKHLLVGEPPQTRLRANMELLINPIKKMSSRNIEMNSIARKI